VRQLEDQRRKTEDEDGDGGSRQIVTLLDEPKQVEASHRRKESDERLRDDERGAEDAHQHALYQIEERRPDQQAQSRILQIVVNRIASHISKRQVMQQVFEIEARHDMPRLVVIEKRLASPKGRDISQTERQEQTAEQQFFFLSEAIISRHVVCGFHDEGKAIG
jgi:hypothetical protein